MALQIKQTHDVLEVIGALTAENASIVKHHFDSFLKKVDHIILSLDGVTTIGPSGAYTIEQLYLDFVKSNRIIHIIGRENKRIAQTMKQTKTSYILSDDRI